MIFSSYLYLLLFLPAAFFLVFSPLTRAFGSAAQLSVLLVASIVFYAYWDWSLLPVIVGSIAFNYSAASIMKLPGGRRPLVLFLGILGNLLFLGYFKYFNFFTDNVESLFGIVVSSTSVALPLAISFYTLQQIAFLVDFYQGSIQEKPTFKRYMSFVLFFPQLIAGPIVHYKYLTSQFTRDVFRIDYQNITIGLLLISLGLFKKVVFGDGLAPFVESGYANLDELSLITSWLLAVAFYLQIYFDFSGYADMAIGSALLFNITLPINFNSPYKSKSLVEFWKRWHITLSDFLNHYLYVPLLRAQKHITFSIAMGITFFVMFISGVWHGAGWGFLVWGCLHGVGLIMNHVWTKYGFKLPMHMPWLITNLFIMVALVFFRADDIYSAAQILKNMFGLNGVVLPYSIESWVPEWLNGSVSYRTNFLQAINFNAYAAVLLFTGLATVLFCKNTTEITKNFSPTNSSLLGIAILLCIAFVTMASAPTIDFIYYEF